MTSPTRGRARIGLLVPFTNSNIEPDLALMRPHGVSIHTARIGGYDKDEIPDAEQMQGLGASDLDDPIKLLSGVRPEVVIYGCTSATLTHGPAFDRQLAGQIAQSTGAQTVTAAGALVFALRALEVERIGFASPYVEAINDMAIGFLADMGVQTIARSEVGAALGNHEQGALDPEAVYELGLRADHPEAQALVLSCTDMRAVEILDRVENTIGKPVISSNQAILFETMHLLGITDPLPGFGQLLARSELRQAAPSPSHV